MNADCCRHKSLFDVEFDVDTRLQTVRHHHHHPHTVDGVCTTMTWWCRQIAAAASDWFVLNRPLSTHQRNLTCLLLISSSRCGSSWSTSVDFYINELAAVLSPTQHMVLISAALWQSTLNITAPAVTSLAVLRRGRHSSLPVLLWCCCLPVYPQR